MPQRAVFDTNILVSAIGWSGNPRRCIELARAGVITGLTCREILEECWRVLASKLQFTDEEALSAVVDLLTVLQLVSIPHRLQFISADPADDKVLECAVEGRATHIVTGDKKHLLSLGNYQGIPIVSADDFLRNEIR